MSYPVTPIAEVTTGISCYECGSDYPDEVECPTHGDDNCINATFTPCPIAEGCTDESHHPRYQAHVIQED